MWPPDSKYLQRNLETLARCQPEAAAAVWAAAPPAAHPGLEVFATPRGPVLSYQGQSLASRTDPIKEAQQLVHAQAAAGTPLVFGWGSGYHTRILARQYPFIWVVEPRPAILRASLTLADFHRLWPRIRFILNRLKPLEPPGPDFLLTHAPSRRLNPEEYAYWQARLSWPPAEEWPALLRSWPDLAAQAAKLSGDLPRPSPEELFKKLPEGSLSEGRLLLALLLLLNTAER